MCFERARAGPGQRLIGNPWTLEINLRCLLVVDIKGSGHDATSRHVTPRHGNEPESCGETKYLEITYHELHSGAPLIYTASHLAAALVVGNVS